MLIIEELRDRSARLETKCIETKLLLLANKVVDASKEHLKLIIAQLPEFDLHDESHSIRILENMTSLITKDVLKNLSSYELFMLYLSAYLHDCAMALPNWELKLLKLTEGSDGFTNLEIEKPLKNDFKSPYSISTAIKIINERKDNLYENFAKIRNFIFCPSNESELIKDLAGRLIEYQEFRNGFTEELKETKLRSDIAGYLELNDLIRYEFVRTTHHSRIEKYVKNLSSLFEEYLDGSWGKALAYDLAKVCRSHGEAFEYISALNVQASYFGDGCANLQFVSLILRIADIIHFSVDRAPKSLFSEKPIRSKESLKHWIAKFQGLNYSIGEIDSDGKVKITFRAFCDEPNMYYFLLEYMNWIDDELNNYKKLIFSLDYSLSTRKFAEKYKLPIAEKVDRSQIKYDEDKFKPSGLCFTLNQKRIIELLMGVGLYKDKYLCLRELYQNSLDACRNMIFSYESRSTNMTGKIEFGLGECEVNGINRSYLYCLDNGLGMNLHIIENYLMKIGNSYYKSREFNRRVATWKDSYTPTSQFGIGILSCFMLGDKIEITTRPADDNSKISEAIRFSIDGPHEHFYFMKPDPLDLEIIGSHGTLVKVFLSEPDSINNIFLDNLCTVIHGCDSNEFVENNKETYALWNQNLYKLILETVGKVPSNIDLIIRFSNNATEKLIPWATPFNYSILEDQVYQLYSGLTYFSDGYNPTADFLKCKDYIETNVINVNYEGIDYVFSLSLPKPGIPVDDWRILNFPKNIYNKAHPVLVDGIFVNSNFYSDAMFDAKRDVLSNGIINFMGTDRPILSVDRHNITLMPESLNQKLNLLPEIVGKKIVYELDKHFKMYNIDLSSKEAGMTWDYILNKFSSLSPIILKNLVGSDETYLTLQDIVNLTKYDISVREFITKPEVELYNFIFNNLCSTSQLLVLGKLIHSERIDVSNNTVKVHSKTFEPVKIVQRYSNLVIFPIAIKADSWDELYGEYDLISNLWPIIPERLFQRIQDFSTKSLSQRAKTTSECSNSLAAIAAQDPVLIHPKLGIFSSRREIWGKKKNMVGKFEHQQDGFWLFELNEHGKTTYQGVDYCIYCFIAPRKLTDDEMITLEDYKEEDSDYYNGVLNGWSILLIGRRSEKVILPGLRKRNEMISRIKKSFWQSKENVKYHFLDGTLLEPIKEDLF
ncbi:hypothetical protein H1S01_17600 [Heliobacterium chlorum]|uniref:HD-CE domain-containing protein n=1 Tax=Heliobacterium chlorum TaxID=2698 RepID=A0ABR7T994_HELCL|nr:hypothetical protein [Heliobacterium chlorum]MBC9786276.1 hypothetical protein [Heliobacterium chlorum]